LFQNILVQSSNIRKSVILKNVAILHPHNDQSRKVLQTSRGVVRGAQCPGRRKVASTFYNTLHLLRKTLGSNMGAPNLFFAPGAI